MKFSPIFEKHSCMMNQFFVGRVGVCRFSLPQDKHFFLPKFVEVIFFQQLVWLAHQRKEIDKLCSHLYQLKKQIIVLVC